MLRATRSTAPSWSSGIRSAAVMTRYSMRFGSPKIASDTRRAMSMSKPSITPLIGLRDPSSSESAETPTTSRPRSRICAMVEPAGRAFGPGSGLSGAYEASGSAHWTGAVVGGAGLAGLLGSAVAVGVAVGSTVGS